MVVYSTCFFIAEKLEKAALTSALQEEQHKQMLLQQEQQLIELPQQTATVVKENVEPNTTNHDSGTSLPMQLEPIDYSESDHHTLVVEHPLETTKLAAQSQQRAPSREARHELPRAPCHFSNDD
jgi:hypothetical protein